MASTKDIWNRKVGSKVAAVDAVLLAATAPLTPKQILAALPACSPNLLSAHLLHLVKQGYVVKNAFGYVAACRVLQTARVRPAAA